MTKRKTSGAAFNTAHVVTIACINEATVHLGVDYDALLRALQTYLDRHFSPVWGIHARLVKSRKMMPDAWAIVFMDTADKAQVLGYHDLTPEGLPLSKIFVKTTVDNGEKVSSTVSHELAEMLVDPGMNLWSAGPKSMLYAYEVCDAVEEIEFDVDGIAMSDFVYPAYFEKFRKRGSVQFDHCERITYPFQVLSGGYSLARDGSRMRATYGSLAKAARFRKQDRTGRRGAYRAADPKSEVALRKSRKK